MPTVWDKPFTPMRLLRMGFRLSLLVGVGSGLYGAWHEFARVNQAKASFESNWSSLRCAARADTEALKRVKHPRGNYDISLLGCGTGNGPDGAFIANATQIEQARRNARSEAEADWIWLFDFNNSVRFNKAIGSWITVNFMAGFLALVWVIGRWVLH